MKNEKNHNNITEMVFILDRSGSMGGLESDTIGGFNAMIEKQKKVDAPAFVTTVLFDHEIERLHDRIPLSDVKPMTDADYTVRGCTALLDAIGDTIEHIETVHRYIRPEDVPEKTIFVITTDGMENASKRFGSDKVKQMIAKKQEAAGWEFLFLGANIDAVETAASIGIPQEHAVQFHSDEHGTRLNYRVLGNAMASMRECAAAPMAADWKEEIEADYKSRGKSIFKKRGKN